MNILFAAGGTGGHISPALNLVEALLQSDPAARAVFLTSGRRIEGCFLRRQPVQAFALFPAENGSRPSPFNPLPWLAAVQTARRLIRDTRPSAAVATGGYVTLPVAAAAALAGLPLYLLEQNAVPGRATRAAARLARRIFCHYEGAAERLGRRAEATGSPLSRAIAVRQAARDEARRFFGLGPERRTLLIAGGSLGASSLNSLAVGSLATFGTAYQILHITGEWDYETVRAFYAVHGAGGGHERVRVLPFCDRMDLAYRAADLIIGRAGGMTVAEICAAGLPSILVPYPHHRDNHQFHNAAVVDRAGAGIVVPEKEAAERGILSRAREILDDPARLERMGAAARALSKPAAAGEILAAIREDLDALPRRGSTRMEGTHAA